MNYQWDPHKAQSNFEKHGVRFSDAISVFMDDFAITIEDDFSDEERFVTIGSDAFGRVLIVVYSFRKDATRLISARPASSHERRQYEGDI